MEGVLLLSETIQENAKFRSQHSEVLNHMLKLLESFGLKHKDQSAMIDKARHLLIARVAVYELITLVEGPVTENVKTLVLNLCDTVTYSSRLLVGWGYYRQASHILQLAGRACRKMGEELDGLEHHLYFLKVLSGINCY